MRVLNILIHAKRRNGIEVQEFMKLCKIQAEKAKDHELIIET